MVSDQAEDATKQLSVNALIFVKQILEDLKLECSPGKTKIASLEEGFQFLGFDIRKGSVAIRQKSREKFEEKIRRLTIRSHNFEDSVIEKLNSVIRGTVNYFCTHFSTVKRYFTDVEKWVRMRLRSMKYKSISKLNNVRCKNKILEKRGLLNIRSLCQRAKKRWKYSLRGQQMGAAH
jgi:RNA-directed DNA polymerase